MLARGGVGLEQVHHGMGPSSWPVLRQAVARGHGIRTGLEDTHELPDGTTATGNLDLVEAAVALARSRQGEALVRRSLSRSAMANAGYRSPATAPRGISAASSVASCAVRVTGSSIVVTCSTRRAPTTGTMSSPRAATHARASWATVQPRRSAVSASRATRASLC